MHFKKRILFTILGIVLIFALYADYKTNENINQYTVRKEVINNVKVLKVIDGDTLRVLIDGKRERVRIIGINSLELDSSNSFAQVAQLELEKLLKNKRVDLHLNPNKTRDKYDRILAKVYRSSDQLWIEGYLLENGLAVKYTFAGYGFSKKELIEKEQIAKQQNLGIWKNIEQTIISAENASKFIDNFKIINGKITFIQQNKTDIIVELNNTLNVVLERHRHNLQVGDHISVRGKIRLTQKHGLRVFTSLENVEKY